MTIAVIIPCYNEEKYIGKLLDDLTKQEVKADSVFIVDCRSEDGTIQEARKSFKKLPVKILKSQHRSAAEARNIGAKAAETDYLMFLDADIRIKPNFLKIVRDTAVSKDVEFVTPRLATNGHHPIDHMFVWGINLWVYVYRMKISHKPSGVAGGAMLIRRESHETIGGYNSKLREFDDIDYIHRMQEHHTSYAFAWKAVANASNRRAVEQGRLATILQGVPDDKVLTRRIIRPLMNRMGIKPKWHDLN